MPKTFLELAACEVVDNGTALHTALFNFTQAIIVEALHRFDGHQGKVAVWLKLHRNTVNRITKRHGTKRGIKKPCRTITQLDLLQQNLTVLKRLGKY